jgi:exodeoxyribonuclease VII small subunit
MPKVEAKEPSFEEIVTRLEEIAQKLEAGDTDLERALELFEEGVKLARAGGDRLDHAEHRLEILRAGEQTETFEPDG